MCGELTRSRTPEPQWCSADEVPVHKGRGSQEAEPKTSHTSDTGKACLWCLQISKENAINNLKVYFTQLWMVPPKWLSFTICSKWSKKLKIDRNQKHFTVHFYWHYTYCEQQQQKYSLHSTPWNSKLRTIPSGLHCLKRHLAFKVHVGEERSWIKYQKVVLKLSLCLTTS